MDNVLILDGRAKIASFTCHAVNDVLEQARLTERCAPECFESKHLTKASTVYAFGIFVAELLTGNGIPPSKEFRKKPKEVRVHPVVSESTVPDFKELLQGCLAYTPSDRFGLGSLLAKGENRISLLESFSMSFYDFV